MEVLSRRTLVPEKWLAGVLALGNPASNVPVARTALLSVRLEEEQQELEEYGLTAHGEDHIDIEEEVCCFYYLCNVSCAVVHLTGSFLWLYG